MYIQAAPLVAALTLLLTACGSSDSTTSNSDTTNGANSSPETTEGSTDGNTDGDITATGDSGDVDTGSTEGNIIRFGFIGVGQNLIHAISEERTLSISGLFFEFPSTATQADLVDRLTAPATLGCEVPRPSDEAVIDPTIPTASSQRVSAGEVITITSAAGTYTTLSRSNTASYLQDSPLTGPPPTGLIANIPGDVFPAFTNVVIPDVAELRLNSPSVGQIFSTSTPIIWDANSGGNTVIVIQAFFSDPATGGGAVAICITDDDGVFSLPAATISELDLSDSAFPTQLVIARTAYRVEANESSALHILNQIGDSFTYSDPESE